MQHRNLIRISCISINIICYLTKTNNKKIKKNFFNKNKKEVSSCQPRALQRLTSINNICYLIKKNNKQMKGKLKDEKYHYMDIVTHPSKNDSYIALEKPINLKSDKSHVRKYVGTKSKKYFFNWLMNYVIS